MLHRKNLEEQLESVRVYHQAQAREKRLRARAVVKAAWRTFQAGQINVFEYGKIVEKNKQLIF